MNELTVKHEAFERTTKRSLMDRHKAEMSAAQANAEENLACLRDELSRTHEAEMRAAEERALEKLRNAEEEYNQKLEIIRTELIDLHKAELIAEKIRSTSEMSKSEAKHNESMMQLKEELQHVHREETLCVSDQRQAELCDTQQHLHMARERITELEYTLHERGKQLEQLREKVNANNLMTFFGTFSLAVGITCPICDAVHILANFRLSH